MRYWTTLVSGTMNLLQVAAVDHAITGIATGTIMASVDIAAVKPGCEYESGCRYKI